MRTTGQLIALVSFAASIAAAPIASSKCASGEKSTPTLAIPSKSQKCPAGWQLHPKDSNTCVEDSDYDYKHESSNSHESHFRADKDGSKGSGKYSHHEHDQGGLQVGSSKVSFDNSHDDEGSWSHDHQKPSGSSPAGNPKSQQPKGSKTVQDLKHDLKTTGKELKHDGKDASKALGNTKDRVDDDVDDDVDEIGRQAVKLGHGVAEDGRELKDGGRADGKKLGDDLDRDIGVAGKQGNQLVDDLTADLSNDSGSGSPEGSNLGAGVSQILTNLADDDSSKGIGNDVNNAVDSLKNGSPVLSNLGGGLSNDVDNAVGTLKNGSPEISKLGGSLPKDVNSVVGVLKDGSPKISKLGDSLSGDVKNIVDSPTVSSLGGSLSNGVDGLESGKLDGGVDGLRAAGSQAVNELNKDLAPLVKGLGIGSQPGSPGPVSLPPSSSAPSGSVSGAGCTSELEIAGLCVSGGGSLDAEPLADDLADGANQLKGSLKAAIAQAESDLAPLNEEVKNDINKVGSAEPLCTCAGSQEKPRLDVNGALHFTP